MKRSAMKVTAVPPDTPAHQPGQPGMMPAERKAEYRKFTLFLLEPAWRYRNDGGGESLQSDHRAV